MSTSNETAFENFLNHQNEESWGAALATLLRSIHEVDRNATQIWFAFYPLALFRALREAALVAGTWDGVRSGVFGVLRADAAAVSGSIQAPLFGRMEVKA